MISSWSFLKWFIIMCGHQTFLEAAHTTWILNSPLLYPCPPLQHLHSKWPELYLVQLIFPALDVVEDAISGWFGFGVGGERGSRLSEGTPASVFLGCRVL